MLLISSYDRTGAGGLDLQEEEARRREAEEVVDFRQIRLHHRFGTEHPILEEPQDHWQRHRVPEERPYSAEQDKQHPNLRSLHQDTHHSHRIPVDHQEEAEELVVATGRHHQVGLEGEHRIRQRADRIHSYHHHGLQQPKGEQNRYRQGSHDAVPDHLHHAAMERLRR